jgi:hypothetical protein
LIRSIDVRCLENQTESGLAGKTRTIRGKEREERRRRGKKERQKDQFVGRGTSGDWRECFNGKEKGKEGGESKAENVPARNPRDSERGTGKQAGGSLGSRLGLEHE